MGDANLCSEKWDDANYDKKRVAQILRNTLDQNNLEAQDVGTTYVADHAQSNNKISESSIDHVYISCHLVNKLTIR